MQSLVLSRDFLSPRAAAALLSISPRCVLDYCALGRLDTLTLTARAVRITASSLTDFIQARTRRSRRSWTSWR